MLRRHLLCKNLGISVAALALGVGAAASFSRTAAGETPAVDGVLVLRNGSVLTGAVRRYGDDYRIDVAGAMLQVPADQVEMFSQTLEEAYEARRRDRTGLSADSHLELARWCMQLDLLSEAARELLDARTLDPGHTGLAALETRLGQMLELQAAGRAAGARGATAAEIVATADEATEPPIDISSEAQTQFVRSIQPMLIHNCATGGCHQPGGGQHLQLDRWALEGNGNAELVRRNLTAVLRELNADDPPSSALMQWARVAHGQRTGSALRPLGAYQAALLLEWLNQAAGVASPEEAPAEGAAEGATGAAPPGETFDWAAPAEEPSSAAREAFTPRDEFDPEIFNRRHAAATSLNADAAGAAESIPPAAE